MRTVLGFACFVVGVLGGLYIAIWWGIVEPIMHIASAIDSGDVTASLIGWEVCKFFLKELAATLWAVVFISIGNILLDR